MNILEDISNIRFIGGDFQFAYPWVLALIPISWILFYFLYRRSGKDRNAIIIPDVTGIKTRPSLKTSLLKFLKFFKIIGFSLLLVALARPQISLKNETVKAKGIDIMIALDVSGSMLSKDFDPNRLAFSKLVAADFINKRKYDRIGLVIFSGEAFTQCPLTIDHKVLAEFLEIARPGLLEDGTAIGMGLATAVNRIKTSSAKSKIIILMTDGVNNTGYIKPQAAAQLAKSLGIKVYTIGIGSRGEALTPVRTPDGRIVYGISKVELDEPLMESIARETGAKYFRATNERELSNIYEDIDRMEQTVIDVKTFRRNTEEFRIFVLAGVLLLLIEWGLRNVYIKPIF